MRIHTETLTAKDIYNAARAAGATVETSSLHGSRTHDHAFEVKLTGNSRRRPNRGSYGVDRDAYAFEVKLTGNSRRRPNGGSYGADRDAYAATWDQWGVFLGLLFDQDTTMRTPYYASGGDFDYRTDGRFSGLDPENITIPLNHDHTFRYQGVPREQGCTKCDTIQRY